MPKIRKGDIMATKKKRYTFTFNHKRYNVFASSEREAGKLIEQRRKRLEKDYDLARGDMLLKDWAYECIDAYKTNMNANTKNKFEALVKHSICEPLGDMRLKTITPIDCQNCLNLNAGKSKSLINSVYQALKFLFRYAKLNHKIALDPTETLVKPHGTKKKRRALTAEERQAVLTTAPKNRSYWVYLLMMICGCRPGEAAEAKRSDISKVTDIKGRTYYILHIRGTKTEKADRKVPIPDWLYELFKDIPEDEYISITRNHGKHGHNWARHFKTFAGHAGLPNDLTAYNLRHEFGTECARRGLDVRITMKLMGHATLRMTIEIYANLETSDILDAAQILNKPDDNVQVEVQPTAKLVENA